MDRRNTRTRIYARILVVLRTVVTPLALLKKLMLLLVLRASTLLPKDVSMPHSPRVSYSRLPRQKKCMYVVSFLSLRYAAYLASHCCVESFRIWTTSCVGNEGPQADGRVSAGNVVADLRPRQAVPARELLHDQ